MKITYIFGAGASANAVPMVRETKGYIEKTILDFLDFYGNADDLVARDLSNKTLLDSLLADLRWIRLLLNDYDTPDQLALDFYNQRPDDNKYPNQEFVKIKNLMAILILKAQFESAGKEGRYLAFWKRIMQGDKYRDFELPKNLNFINWNYDSMFYESRFLSKSDCEENSLKYEEILKPFENTLANINGTAGFLAQPGNQVRAYYEHMHLPSYYKYFPSRFPIRGDAEFNFKYELLRLHARLQQFEYSDNTGTKNGISYAFEDDGKNKEKALNFVKDSDFIVTIGYSFPEYNKEIDHAILGKFKGKRIYVQDMRSEIADKIRRFFSNTEIVKHVNEVDQFYIPYEWKPEW
ncbi:MAG: hypothetical protein RIG68_00930 [Imperialibacter sp.]|uniref:hypothetical protein n=1 Tax=Imperialibacter sp. TaxID=2038411 RepID=UPI0032EEC8E8